MGRRQRNRERNGTAIDPDLHQFLTGFGGIATEEISSADFQWAEDVVREGSKIDVNGIDMSFELYQSMIAAGYEHQEIGQEQADYWRINRDRIRAEHTQMMTGIAAIARSEPDSIAAAIVNRSK